MNFLRLFINLFQFNRTNWKAVALCVIAAAVFWLFNAFNKNYATNIRFPLTFDYNHEKYIAASVLPDRVNINVSGNGWDLFRKNLGLKLPSLSIPLERPAEVKKIVGSTLPPLFASQLGGLQINYIVTDTLRLHIDERDYHKFRLAVDLSEITFANGMGRTSRVQIIPDSVSLEGPKNVLHNLPDSIRIRLPKQRVSNSYQEEIEIELTNQDFIHRTPPVVTVKFDVGKMQEITAHAMVKGVKPPSSKLEMKDSVSFSVRIPAARANEFASHAGVEAWIDLSQLRKGKTVFTPRITGLPDYAQLISVDSLSVTRF